jgi:hypothetical protein
MLETIAKGRLETRSAGTLPKTQGKAKAVNNPDLKLQDVLDQQREQEIREELMIQRQRDQYDFHMAERTELDREYNELRDLMLAQMKQDDEVVKKYVAMI